MLLLSHPPTMQTTRQHISQCVYFRCFFTRPRLISVETRALSLSSARVFPACAGVACLLSPSKRGQNWYMQPRLAMNEWGYLLHAHVKRHQQREMEMLHARRAVTRSHFEPLAIGTWMLARSLLWKSASATQGAQQGSTAKVVCECVCVHPQRSRAPESINTLYIYFVWAKQNTKTIQKQSAACSQKHLHNFSVYFYFWNTFLLHTSGLNIYI